MTTIGYLAHDLSDPAIARRVAMLHAGGATVRLAGLLRAESVPPALAGFHAGQDASPPLVLGQSHDARLARRAAMIGRIMLSDLDRINAHFGAVDALLARNLEMLVIAVRVADLMAAAGAKRPRIVYECLDIHRLMTSSGAPGALMRAIERRAGRHVDLVLTSSPAFVDNHLGRGPFGDRIMLVENKVLDLPGTAEDAAALPAPPTPAGPPWRIGWFGALRCRRSFDLLAEAARRAEGRIEVVIRGRPSPAIFPDLAALADAAPHLSFGGPYDHATELGTIYSAVHFAWCVDFYEEGGNSAWLLPNRLYESAFHNTQPVALGTVETGRFIARQGLGVVLDEATPETLVTLFSDLDASDYGRMSERLAQLPRALWSASASDCAALVQAVAGRPAAAGHLARAS